MKRPLADDGCGPGSGGEPGSRRGLAWILSEAELYLLGLAGMVVFIPQLFFERTLFWKDLSFYFLPQKEFLRALVRVDGWPLWNPWWQGGQAFLTSLSNAVLAPTNLALAVVSPLRALNLAVAVHLAVALAAAYALARVLRFGRVAAVVSAVAFAASGVTLSLVNLLNHFAALTLLPLVLVLWLLWLRESRARWSLLVVVVATAQLFVGSPELSLLSFVMMLGVVCARASSRGELRLGVVRWCVVVSCTILLGAVQLVPTAEVVLGSPRGFGFSAADLGTWSLHPKRTAEIALPYLLGHVDELDDDAFWGERLVDGGTPYLISVYFGVSVLLLALWGGLSRRGPENLRPGTRRTLLALLAAAPVAAFGRHLPWADAVADVLPMASLFRYPSKLIVIGVLPCALLAGWAVDALRVRRETSPSPGSDLVRSAPLVVWLTAALGTLAGLAAMAVSRGWLDTGLASFFALPVDTAMRDGVGASLVHAAAMTLATGLLMLLAGNTKRPRIAWGFVALVAVDLAVGGARINPSCPDWVLTDEPPAVEVVRAAIGGGRMYRAPEARQLRLDAPTDDVAWLYRRGMETLAAASAARWRIPVIFHPDVVQLSPLPLMKLKVYLDALPWKDKLPILAAGAVTVIVTDEALTVDGVELVDIVPCRGGEQIWVYRHLNAAPKAGFVSSARRASSDEVALDLMRSGDFDPRRELVLAADGGGEPAGGGNRETADDARVEIVTQMAHRRVLRVHCARDGYLVFADPHAPGWRATVDGVPRPLLRANIAFSCVPVSAGDHVVEHFYRPQSFVAGAAVSGVALLTLLSVAIAARRRASPSSRTLTGC